MQMKDQLIRSQQRHSAARRKLQSARQSAQRLSLFPRVSATYPSRLAMLNDAP
jgi:hypothetical protein